MDASDAAANELISDPDWALHVGEPDAAPAAESPAKERADPNGYEAVTADVDRAVEHLRSNRTTVRQAETLRDAATRSITDHAAARSINR